MSNKNTKKFQESERVSIDSLDIKILNLLSSNSRLSFRSLSAHLNVSPTTVSERIKKLEKSGIIKKYSISLDHGKIGYDLPVIIEINVSKGKLVEVEKEISKNKNVLAVYDVTGRTDAFVIAKFRDRKELSKFVKSLLSNPFIERTNTHVILNIIKEDFSNPIV